MKIKVVNVNNQNELKNAQTVAIDAFSTTPDASLDEWFSFVEMVKMVNEDRGLCLLALGDADEPVGMIFAGQESHINGKEGREKWVVIFAGVKPKETGKGIGKLMLVEMEKQASQRGVKKMFVFTNKGDDRVINFYKKNGYEDAGWIKDYQYGEDNCAVFLLKYL